MFNEIFKYENGNLINIKTEHIYYNKDKDGYIRVRILGKEYRAHRIIWTLFNGPIPENMLIDHIDGDVSNNNISNLRLSSRQQNNANSSGNKNANIKAKGITINPSGKYRVRITYRGITYSLGTYSALEEAKEVYKNKAIELNGEYASTRS